jgi:hypothetical protein
MKRRRKGPECNGGIKDRSARLQLRLRKERTSGRILRRTVELEIEKRIVGSSSRLRKVSDWTLWRGRPLPKRKERRPKRSPWKRRMTMVNLDLLTSDQATARDEQP